MNSFQNRRQACNFIKKETLAQVFSCEFCEIFKNTYFYRTPLVAASVLFRKLRRFYQEKCYAFSRRYYTALSLWECLV